MCTRIPWYTAVNEHHAAQTIQTPNLDKINFDMFTKIDFWAVTRDREGMTNVPHAWHESKIIALSFSDTSFTISHFSILMDLELKGSVQYIANPHFDEN